MAKRDSRKEGLTTEEAKALQERYGKNELSPQKKESFLTKIRKTICEPMFLLLFVAAIIYFILGEPGDGGVMLIFVVGIVGIDVIQEWKTDQTLSKLKTLTAPHITVLRDGEERSIASGDLVPGDLMFLQEGIKIPADGVIVSCNDLCIDESSLTGEAEGVWKGASTAVSGVEENTEFWRKDYCYGGTLVMQGTATVLVDKIGASTEYGKIGSSLCDPVEGRTPLQNQTANLVGICAVIAGILFALVGIFTYLELATAPLSQRLIESVLAGVTLAMAMIPEEFPVILAVFLSMGAWRLAKKHSLVRRLPSVETLGAVTVLCVDKTGTVTMNKMEVEETWVMEGTEEELWQTMGLACETEAYDPMEKAMLAHCESRGIGKTDLFQGSLIHEYSFTDETKMMGHVWEKGARILVAAKGSPEAIFTVCSLSQEGKKRAEERRRELSAQGLRVIAVAKAELTGKEEIAEDIRKCTLCFQGLIGLADPPRESLKGDIARCREAGIRVVMITGDHGDTASAIAKKIGMEAGSHIVTGSMLEQMSDGELGESAKTVNIFSRVVPKHKMRIVRAFQQRGEIVGMTGDGVNDAPALKRADIGIAMGKRGSEVSKEAADLILMDDNFTTIVETVKDGRRIYDNIRKAVGYVFTIHIPIGLAALLAPVLGIAPPSFLLLPLHVVILELLIDPTCSIVLERQPAEEDLMRRQPRNPKGKLLDLKTLSKSIFQGLAIFAASFGAYVTMLVQHPQDPTIGRTMGLAIIMLSNLFLVQVNSSDRDSVLCSLMKLAKDNVMWAVWGGTMAMLGITIYSPLNGFLKLSPLSLLHLGIVILMAVVAVFWYEIVKLVKRQGEGEDRGKTDHRVSLS